MTRFLSIPLLSLLFVSTAYTEEPTSTRFPASSPEIQYTGRIVTEGDSTTFAYPGVEIVIEFTGSQIGLSGEILGNSSHFNITLDGDTLPRLDLYSGSFDQEIATGLDGSKPHTLRLVRRSESWIGVTRLDSVTLSQDGKLTIASSPYSRKMICIGDSITCGEKADLFGYVENGPLAWNAEKSYAWQLAKIFDAAPNLVSYGGRGLIRDWQGKSDSATGPQLFERVLPDDENSHWDHKRFTPDLVTICLGTNDFSQGIPSRDEFVPTYVDFVKRIHEVHPSAKILLISGPWFGEGDPKKEALNAYIEETIKLSQSKGEAFVSHHFFDTTYPGTKRDAHPIAPQHTAMAKDISQTVSTWLGW